MDQDIHSAVFERGCWFLYRFVLKGKCKVVEINGAASLIVGFSCYQITLEHNL